jgi:hypothetical protein
MARIRKRSGFDGGLRQRDPRAIDGEYKAWIAAGPCVACLALKSQFVFGVHVAHLRMPDAEAGKRETGMQEKPSDMWTTPLCPAHHQHGPDAQHNMGERHFWFDFLQIDPFALCIALEIAFRQGQKATPVIIHFAAEARKRRSDHA